MRKLKFLQRQLLLAVSVCMMIFMTSCEQESIETPNETINSVESVSLEQDQPIFTKYNLNEQRLVEMDAENRNEVEINRLMLAYAEKIMKALQSERLLSPSERNAANIKEEISQFAEAHNNDFIPIRDLASTYQQRQNLPSGKGIERPITYEGVEYEFILNVPNIENADFSLNPIISPGLKARRDTDDSVFGWYLNDENMPEKILLSEAEGMEMRNPLIVVSPHPVEGQPGYILEYRSNDALKEEQNSIEKSNMPGALVLDQYQVKNPNFFEDNGGLEYRVFVNTTLPNSFQYSTEGGEVKNLGITRDDVITSRIFNDDISLGGFSDTQNFLANRDYYILSYERDWARSRKSTRCDCSCHNSSFYILNPRMRFAGDFWNQLCGRGDLAWPNVNSTLTDDNNFGRIVITRTI